MKLSDKFSGYTHFYEVTDTNFIKQITVSNMKDMVDGKVYVATKEEIKLPGFILVDGSTIDAPE